MKINRLQIGCIAAAVAFFLLGNVQAVTIVLNGANGSNLMTLPTATPYALGTIINGIQAGGQTDRDVLMVNNLLSIGTNSFASIGGEEYHRGSLGGPAAAAVGSVMASGGGLAFGTNAFGAIASLTLSSVFQYLVVAYDGPNGGVIVYNIGSLPVGTVIEMPRYAQPAGAAGSQTLVQDDGQYQMTGWTLLNPGGTTVPDGGATLMLLGAALTGLGAMRRFVKN